MLSRMYRVALRIVGSPDAAREVAQDACVRALRGTEQFDGRVGPDHLAPSHHRQLCPDHLGAPPDGPEPDRLGQGTTGMLAMLEATPAERAERTSPIALP